MGRNPVLGRLKLKFKLYKSRILKPSLPNPGASAHNSPSRAGTSKAEKGVSQTTSRLQGGERNRTLQLETLVCQQKEQLQRLCLSQQLLAKQLYILQQETVTIRSQQQLRDFRDMSDQLPKQSMLPRRTPSSSASRGEAEGPGIAIPTLDFLEAQDAADPVGIAQAGTQAAIVYRI